MGNIEKLSDECVYEGSVFTLSKCRMRLADGSEAVWDFIKHRRCGAAAVPVLPDGRIILVEQTRPVLGRRAYEIPAGAREKAACGKPRPEAAGRAEIIAAAARERRAAGFHFQNETGGGFEDTAGTAYRELLEETGHAALSLSFLLRSYSSPAYNTEFTDIYLAEVPFEAEGQKLDAGEDITCAAFAREEILQMIGSGEIVDSKTVAGLLAALRRMERSGR